MLKSYNEQAVNSTCAPEDASDCYMDYMDCDSCNSRFSVGLCCLSVISLYSQMIYLYLASPWHHSSGLDIVPGPFGGFLTPLV